MAGGKRDRQVTYSEEAAERKEEDYKSAPWPFVPFALVAVLFTKVIAGWHAHNGGIQLKEDVSPGEVKARGVKLNDDEFERLKHAAQLIRGNSKAAADTTASVQPPAPKAPAKPRFRKPATRGPYKAFSTLTSNDQKAARRREIRLAVGGQQPRLAKGKPLTPAFQQRVESHRREEALSIASAFDNATLCELFNQTQHRNVEKARHQLKSTAVENLLDSIDIDMAVKIITVAEGSPRKAVIAFLTYIRKLAGQNHDISRRSTSTHTVKNGRQARSELRECPGLQVQLRIRQLDEKLNEFDPVDVRFSSSASSSTPADGVELRNLEAILTELVVRKEHSYLDPEKHTLTFALRVDSGRVQNYTVSVQAWTFLTPVQLGIEGAQAHAVSDMMITGLYAGKKETAELVEMTLKQPGKDWREWNELEKKLEIDGGLYNVRLLAGMDLKGHSLERGVSCAPGCAEKCPFKLDCNYKKVGIDAGVGVVERPAPPNKLQAAVEDLLICYALHGRLRLAITIFNGMLSHLFERLATPVNTDGTRVNRNKELADIPSATERENEKAIRNMEKTWKDVTAADIDLQKDTKMKETRLKDPTITGTMCTKLYAVVKEASEDGEKTVYGFSLILKAMGPMPQEKKDARERLLIALRNLDGLFHRFDHDGTEWTFENREELIKKGRPRIKEVVEAWALARIKGAESGTIYLHLIQVAEHWEEHVRAHGPPWMVSQQGLEHLMQIVRGDLKRSPKGGGRGKKGFATVLRGIMKTHLRRMQVHGDAMWKDKAAVLSDDDGDEEELLDDDGDDDAGDIEEEEAEEGEEGM